MGVGGPKLTRDCHEFFWQGHNKRLLFTCKWLLAQAYSFDCDTHAHHNDKMTSNQHEVELE